MSKIFKKNFGQNFLRHQRFAEKLVSALDLEESDTVVEIGPGNGMITNLLLRRNVQVICIEIDYDLLANLIKRFREYPNFKLIHDDFLKLKIEDIFQKYTPTGKIKFTGNLPFNISKKIINKLLNYSGIYSIEKMSFIVQDEVAKAYAANPPKSSFLSTSANLKANIKKLESIPATQFFPVPHVNAGIIAITPKHEDQNNLESLRKFIHIGFSSPRKKLINNLENSNKYSKEEIKNALNKFNLNENIRASELTIEDWKNLQKSLDLS